MPNYVVTLPDNTIECAGDSPQDVARKIARFFGKYADGFVHDELDVAGLHLSGADMTIVDPVAVAEAQAITDAANVAQAEAVAASVAAGEPDPTTQPEA